MILTTLKWFGTLAGIAGAVLIALNIPESGWGFVLFLGSSVCWGLAAIMMKESSLGLLQATFTIINVMGVYRWLLV